MLLQSNYWYVTEKQEQGNNVKYCTCWKYSYFSDINNVEIMATINIINMPISDLASDPPTSTSKSWPGC